MRYQYTNDKGITVHVESSADGRFMRRAFVKDEFIDDVVYDIRAVDSVLEKVECEDAVNEEEIRNHQHLIKTRKTIETILGLNHRELVN